MSVLHSVSFAVLSKYSLFFYRQPRPPLGIANAWFEAYELPYGEEAYDLLREMGIAKRDDASDLCRCGCRCVP